MGAESCSAILLQPFTSWAMDLIGPLPASKKGNTWIVTKVEFSSFTIVAAAAAETDMSSEAIVFLTFCKICCRFGLPLNLTMDNDVKSVSLLWESLWHLCGTKLHFTSNYKPQSDTVDCANPQVFEALRAAVATVAQYNEWDDALPHVIFGLNTHMRAVTKVRPFEFANEFHACVPLTMGLPDPVTLTDEITNNKVVTLAKRIAHRHNAASDHMAAAQVWVGQLLEKRSICSESW